MNVVKPISVNILNSTLTLVADRKYEIHCVTSGSRPDAIITWFKGKKSPKRIRDYSKNNETTSILNFVPSIEDNGKMLTCHAENPNVAGMFVEDSWNMSVFCVLIDTVLICSWSNWIFSMHRSTRDFIRTRIEAPGRRYQRGWWRLLWVQNRFKS